MKKLFSSAGFIIFFLSWSAVSCEKNNNNEELLIGKWHQVSQRTTDYRNGTRIFDKTESLSPKENVIEFLSDGTEKVYLNNSIIYTASWVLKGDLLITTVGDVSNDIKFTVNGNTLTLFLTVERSVSDIKFKTETNKVFNRSE